MAGPLKTRSREPETDVLIRCREITSALDSSAYHGRGAEIDTLYDQFRSLVPSTGRETAAVRALAARFAAIAPVALGRIQAIRNQYREESIIPTDGPVAEHPAMTKAKTGIMVLWDDFSRRPAVLASDIAALTELEREIFDT